jgi:hypothetical protein
MIGHLRRLRSLRLSMPERKHLHARTSGWQVLCPIATTALYHIIFAGGKLRQAYDLVKQHPSAALDENRELVIVMVQELVVYYRCCFRADLALIVAEPTAAGVHDISYFTDH